MGGLVTVQAMKKTAAQTSAETPMIFQGAVLSAPLLQADPVRILFWCMDNQTY